MEAKDSYRVIVGFARSEGGSLHGYYSSLRGARTAANKKFSRQRGYYWWRIEYQAEPGGAWACAEERDATQELGSVGVDLSKEVAGLVEEEAKKHLFGK